MIKFFKVLAITLFLITVLSGCNSDSNKEVKDGEKGGKCFEDNTCNDELRCIEGFCIDLGDMADYPDVDPAESVLDGETPDDENDDNGVDPSDLIDECGFDIEVSTKEDLGAVVRCKTITGSLIFEGTDFEEITLPYLEEAWGYFDVTGNLKLKKVSLPKLEYAGTIFAININPELKTIVLPRFQQVGGNLLIGMNDSLETFSLPEFTKAEDGIYVDFNESLKYFEFPKLTTVGKELFIYKNNSLESFSLPELKTTRDLFVARNSVLETFDFFSFIETGDIVIAYNPQLPTELAEELVERVKEESGAFVTSEICENKDSTVKCYDDYDWDWDDM